MGIFGRIKEWVKTKAHEDEVRGLTDRELKDIGCSRYDLDVPKALKTRTFGS